MGGVSAFAVAVHLGTLPRRGRADVARQDRVRQGSSVNPLTWKREHQIALVLAVVVGMVLGTIVGYVAYAAGSDASGARRFGSWMWTCRAFNRYGCMYDSFWNIWWTITGGAVGAAVVYIRRLTSS